MPAGRLEDVGQLRGGRAGVGHDVRPAVPQHAVALFDGAVVAAPVTTQRFLGMGAQSVELDDGPIGVVADVVVVLHVATNDGHLAATDWKPMGPFDIAQVAPLQHRVAAGFDVSDHAGELGPPPELLALAERIA